MTVLDVVYASAPTDEVIIPTLEISSSAFDTIRICNGFEDHTVTLETSEVVVFEASGLDIALPASDTSGQQELMFAVGDVLGAATKAVQAATDAGATITAKFRPYLVSDLSAPAGPVFEMAVVGAQFEAGMAQITCAYFDFLNTLWQRARYTASFAPGIQYL